MNSIDWIVIGFFSALLLFKTAKYAAVRILGGYALYFAVIVPLPGEYYYHVTALLNLIIGCILFSRYKSVAILSFSLILVNSIGLLLFGFGYAPTLYNSLSLIIILLQILLLYIRALNDGNHIRGNWGRALVLAANCDSMQSSYKTLPPKKES